MKQNRKKDRTNILGISKAYDKQKAGGFVVSIGCMNIFLAVDVNFGQSFAWIVLVFGY